jgi:hypothetical protein
MAITGPILEVTAAYTRKRNGRLHKVLTCGWLFITPRRYALVPTPLFILNLETDDSSQGHTAGTNTDLHLSGIEP